jgi:hypothetical protein
MVAFAAVGRVPSWGLVHALAGLLDQEGNPDVVVTGLSDWNTPGPANKRLNLGPDDADSDVTLSPAPDENDPAPAEGDGGHAEDEQPSQTNNSGMQRGGSGANSTGTLAVISPVRSPLASQQAQVGAAFGLIVGVNDDSSPEIVWYPAMHQKYEHLIKGVGTIVFDPSALTNDTDKMLKKDLDMVLSIYLKDRGIGADQPTFVKVGVQRLQVRLFKASRLPNLGEYSCAAMLQQFIPAVQRKLTTIKGSAIIREIMLAYMHTIQQAIKWMGNRPGALNEPSANDAPLTAFSPEDLAAWYNLAFDEKTFEEPAKPVTPAAGKKKTKK